MTDHDSRPSPPGGFHWGRVVSLAGAAGLCVSFFVPQIDIWSGPGRATPVIPVEFTMETYGLFLVTAGLPFLAAFQLLPLLVLRVVPQVDGAPGVGKFLAVVDCVICLSALFIGLAWTTCLYFMIGFGWDMRPFYAVSAVTVVSLMLAITALVRSRLPRKAAAAQFALGASCLAYFALFASDYREVHAGLWISLAGSGLLATGAAIDWFQCRPARKW